MTLVGLVHSSADFPDSERLETATVLKLDFAHNVDRLMTGLLDQYIAELKIYGLNLCRRADLADDLVQLTCIKAWRYRHKYDFTRSGAGWLKRVLRNEYLQHIRKNARLVDMSDDKMPEQVAHLGSETQTHDRIVLQQALSMLPDQQRDALILVLAYGFSYDEVADISGTAAGTIKSRVSRGRDTLVDALRPAVSCAG